MTTDRHRPEPAGAGILVIAYHFPPSAAVGGRRPANFASALRRLGWRSHALTIPEGAIEQIDRGPLKDVADVPVHIASVWPTFVSVLSWAIKTLRPRPRESGGAPSAMAAATSAKGAGAETLARRLRRYVMSFALLPDGEKGWTVPAVIAAVRVIKRERLEWFMTSCPPYSVHVIGLAVKKLTGARWVADFRDPWMTTGSKRLFPTCSASLAIERWLERRVVEQADLVLFNVDRLKRAYRDRYTHVSPDKFVFIPNGFAVDRAHALAPPEKFDRFTICYTGALYVGRSPEPVFAAVARLIRSGRVAAHSIAIKLVGHCRVIDGVPTDSVIRRHGLEGVVDVQDSVPYAVAFDMVRRSHLALLLAPNLPYQIPAKVYDYFAAGTRVLAIAEDGGTADLLRETQVGVAFHGGDIDRIAAFLQDEIARGAEGSARPVGLDRFDVGHIAQELAGHLVTAAPVQVPVEQAS